MRVLGISSAVFATLLLGCTAAAQTPPARASSASPEPCAALAGKDFTTLRDAPSQVVNAVVRAGGENVPASHGDAPPNPAMARSVGLKPAACIVNGYSAPTIGWRVWLPVAEAWNGKLMQQGCGGRCGWILSEGCEMMTVRGYACIAADLGHKGTMYDNVWAIDNPLGEVDFGFRATHVANLVGRAIVQAYYGKPPRYVYYTGASTGGRQGLAAAQRFPEDFDGIVAGEPAYTRGVVWRDMESGPSLAPAEILAPGGVAKITAAELEMVGAYVNAKCDMQDNVRDGLMADPRACRYDPAELLCKAEKTPQCLTEEQVGLLRRVYAPARDAKTGITLRYAPLPGSEARWVGAYVSRDGSGGRYRTRSASTYRYPYAPLFNDSSNVDLRPFKAAGGKMILYQGWMDEVTVPENATDYYETVERVMGGRDKTQDFFRLFMLPGQSHIPGGPGAEVIDYVEALENWVEKGQPPDRLVAHKLKDPGRFFGPLIPKVDLAPENIVFTRPAYPYPTQARYGGRGDPNDHRSFQPQSPKAGRP